MNTQYWPFVLGAVVLMLAYGYWRYFQQRKKTNAFMALAQQHGWQYSGADAELPHRFTGRPFGEGFGHAAHHALTGQYRGHHMAAFEYVYFTKSTTDNSSSTTTHKYTVVSVSTPPRPTLEVTREGLGRKMLGFVGVRDLQLESDEFNKTFLISTDNDRFAYDILHPRMMQWMLADQRAMSWLPFRFEAGNLLTWQEGTPDPRGVMYLLEYVCDILDRVPSFVWKD